MKTLILLTFAATIAIIKADDSTGKSELAEHAAFDAATLSQLLSDNWEVRTKNNEITLTSKFEVFIIALISRGGGLPEFSDKTPRKLLAEDTKPEKYVIHLRYVSSMPPEEYVIKRQERHKLAYLISLGAPTKEEYVALKVKFHNLKMPRYRRSLCDVYEELPDGIDCQVYPPKALQKVGGAKEILRAVLNQVLTDID